MSGSAETLSLANVPMMRQSLMKLFALINVDFDGGYLSLNHVNALLDVVKENVASIRSALPNAKAQDIVGKALVISDLGIISQQIRLILMRHKIAALATGLSDSVAKYLENDEYNYVILELPSQVTEMTSQAASLPKMLSYLFEFNRIMEGKLTIIIIMNRKDPRKSSLEQLADHIVLKESGWQQHLEALVK